MSERHRTALRRARPAAFALLLAAPASTCASSPAPPAPGAPPPALAVVDGDTITTADLDRLLLRTHRGMSAAAKESFDYRRLLDQLVNDRLIIHEAEGLALDEEPEFVAAREAARQRLLAEAYVKARFDPEITVSPEEIDAYFQRYYGKLQLRTVAVGTREEAERLRAAVARGADMDSLARQVSLDSQRYRGGLHHLKFVADVEAPLRDAAAGLAAGEISPPFPYRQVYAFLRVEARAPADAGDRERFADTISGYLTSEARKKAWADFVDALARQFPVTVDSLPLADIRADSAVLFSGEFLRGTARCVMRAEPAPCVTETDLRREVSHLAMRSSSRPFAELVADGVARRRDGLLVGAAAAAAGFADSARVRDAVQAYADSTLVQRYLSEIVYPQIAYTPEEIADYYRLHPDRFRQPDEVELAALRAPEEADAREIAGRLRSGADLGFLSRQFAPRGVTAEAPRWVSLTDLPGPEAAELDTLAAGSAAGPYPAAEGWTVYQVRARRARPPRSLAEAEADIRQALFQEKFNETLDRNLAPLKAHGAVTLFPDRIREYFGEGS